LRGQRVGNEGVKELTLTRRVALRAGDDLTERVREGVSAIQLAPTAGRRRYIANERWDQLL